MDTDCEGAQYMLGIQIPPQQEVQALQQLAPFLCIQGIFD